MTRLLMLGLVWLLTSQAALADAMTVALSSHRVSIASNFVGTEVLLFGGIDRDQLPGPRTERLDLVVIVRGPRSGIVARKKESFLGFWLNAEQRTYFNVPSYHAVLSTRPLSEIAEPEILAREEIGLRVALSPPHQPSGGTAFRDALLRLKIKNGLWSENPKGVSFINPNLFRATVPVPANVPIGRFEIEALLFSGGAIIARQISELEVLKVGFEDQIVDLARERPVLYGLGSAGLAILCGWLASVAFRRE